MGLAQSKRSVNITTDPAKDGVVTEGAGKLEKIGEVDQLKAQANGDAQHNDADNETKVETDAAENEKDSTTEKANKEGGDGGGGDTSVAATSPTSEKEGESDANNKSLENGTNDESMNDSKAPADDANKKAKKPKKKWSFRSLSFSKKDKQKPVKKEKDEERVNGECEKVPEEPTEDAAAASAVAQEVASTTVEAGTSESKTEVAAAAVAATEVSTTTAAVAAPVVADVTTTTNAPADTTKVEEPVVEVAAQESVTPVAVAAVEAKVEEPVKVAVVENGQSKDVVEEPTVPKVQEEKLEPETTTAAAAPVEEKVVEPAVVEVNTSTPTTSTTTTTSSPAVEVENKPEPSVESETASTSTAPSNTTDLDNSTTIIPTSVENVVSESEKVVEGGDSTPPPPLPSIPPPSKVMVFVEASMAQVASDPSSIEESPSLVSDPQQGERDEVKSQPTVAPVDNSPVEVPEKSVEVNEPVVRDVSPLESLPSTVETKEDHVVAFTEETKQAEDGSDVRVKEEPIAVPEEPVVLETVSQVTAAPESDQALVSEEIKETATKTVGEILEQAVDKIESGEVLLAPAAPVEVSSGNENVTQENVKETDLSVPLPEVEAIDEISNNIDDLPPPPPPPAVDDEEAVPDSLPSPLPTIAAAVPADMMGADELKQQDTSVLSVDISSPLPQNSLESLPSPPTLSQSDVSLPPPPESPTACALPEQQGAMPEPDVEPVAVLPSPPPAPSSTGDDPTSSSIPSSLPEAEVEVAKHEEVAKQQMVDSPVAASVVDTAAIVLSTETTDETEKQNKSVTTAAATSSPEKMNEQEASAEEPDAKQNSLPAMEVAAAETATEAKVPEVAVPTEVEETVAQKHNGTVENGTSHGMNGENGKIENGTTENGSVENGQNGVHETSATESLNGAAEHKKEDKIPEKTAQLQQPPPAAPEVTAE